jgi:hypothetical protein
MCVSRLSSGEEEEANLIPHHLSLHRHPLSSLLLHEYTDTHRKNHQHPQARQQQPSNTRGREM